MYRPTLRTQLPVFFSFCCTCLFDGVLCTTTTTSASLSTCTRLSLPVTTNRSLPNSPSYFFFSVPFTRSSLFGVRA
uniref:Putative secreted protein n=1 Tax=Ixodes ricinus TaxID=34613 RepID=A0A6B0UBI3_IXORI